MIRVLLVGCLPLSAQADGWAPFLAQCLTPMIEARLPAIDGLERGQTTTYEIGGDMRLEVTMSNFGEATACRVIAPGGALEANQFLAWSSQPEVFSQYEDVDLGDGALTLRTSDWREPRLDVAMNLTVIPDHIVLSATDTDLES